MYRALLFAPTRSSSLGRRTVTTTSGLTPLASAFNAKQQSKVSSTWNRYDYGALCCREFSQHMYI